MADLDQHDAITTFHALEDASSRSDADASSGAYDKLSGMGFTPDEILAGVKAVRDNRTAAEPVAPPTEEGPGILGRIKVNLGIDSPNLVPPEITAADDKSKYDLSPGAREAGETMAKPWIALGKGLAISGPRKTMETARDLTQKLTNDVSDVTGLPTAVQPGEQYSGVAKLIDEAQKYVYGKDPTPPVADPKNSSVLEDVMGGVGEGITGDLPLLMGASELAGPTAGMGIFSALKKHAAGGSPGEVALEGAKGALMGGALHETSALSPLPRAAVAGGGTAATTLLEGGSPRDATVSGLTMSAMAGTSPGGDVRLRDVAADAAAEGQRIATNLGTKASEFRTKAGDFANRAAADAFARARGFRLASGVAAKSVYERAREIAAAAKRASAAPTSEDMQAAIQEQRSRGGGLYGLPLSKEVYDVPKELVTKRPEQMQYKLDADEAGVVPEFRDTKTFNQDLAGPISLWRDPATGENVVVNGHNRLAIAERDPNQKTIQARFIKAGSAEEARSIGAMQNIAEGRGTPIDAAKLMRDRGVSPADLERYGISLKGRIASQGAGLANLEPGLFYRVSTEQLHPEIGARIGRDLPDAADQHALLQKVQESGREPRDAAAWGELVQQVLADKAGLTATDGKTEDMFGGAPSFSVERAELAAEIMRQLQADKNVAGGAAKNADKLKAEGIGSVDKKAAADARDRFAQVREAFDRLKNASGEEVSAILNRGAQRIKNGESLDKVAKELVPEVRTALEGSLGIGTKPPVSDAAEAEAQGQSAFLRRPGAGPQEGADALNQEQDPLPKPMEMTPEFYEEQERQAFWASEGELRDKIADLQKMLDGERTDKAGLRDAAEQTLRIYEEERTRRAERIGKLGAVDPEDEPPGPNVDSWPDSDPTEFETKPTLSRAPGMPEGIERPTGPIDGVAEPTGDEPVDELPLIGTGSGWRNMFGVRKPQNKTQLKEIIKRSKIIREMAKRLDMVARIGRIKVKGALGLWKLVPGVARVVDAKDMMSWFHEFGHGIDQRVFSNAPGEPSATIKPNLFKPFFDELSKIATWGMPGPEGFAEFVALYVVEPHTAAEKAPRFFKFFEDSLERNAPEILETLRWGQEQMRRYDEMDPYGKVLSNMSSGENPKNARRESEWYKNWVYDRVALKNYRDLVADPAVRDKFWARIPFSDLEALKDPDLLMRLLPGWLGKADSWLRSGTHGQLDYATLSTIGRPFEAIVEPIQDHEKFKGYLLSLRTLEEVTRADMKGKDAPKTAIDPKDARDYVKAYEVEQPKARSIAREVHQFQRNLLKYVADSGLVSQRDYAKIARGIQNYVPFYRVMEDDVEGGFTKTQTGTQGAVVGLHSPIHRFHGSQRDIIDPYESIVKNVHTFVYLAERNQIGQALFRLSRRAKGQGAAGRMVEEVPSDLVAKLYLSPKEIEGFFSKYTHKEVSTTVKDAVTNLKQTIESTVTGADGKPAPGNAKAQKLVEDRVLEALKARGFSDGESRQMVDRIKNAPAGERETVINNELEKVRTVEIKEEMKVTLPTESVPIFRPDIRMNGEPIVTVHFDGVPHYLRLSEDMYSALRGTDREVWPTLQRVMSPASRILRAGVVLSPEFGPMNFFRDQPMAFLQSKYGFIPFYDPLWGSWQYVKHWMAQHGDTSGTAGNQWVKDFYISGAPMSDLMAFDRKYMQTGMNKVLRDVGAMIQAPDDATRFERMRILAENGLVKAGANPRGVWLLSHPIEALRAFNELSDNVTRLGLYARAVKVETTRMRAAENARRAKAGLAPMDSTMDPAFDLSIRREILARGGLEGREGSLDFAKAGIKGRALNSVIAFFNIAPQGIDRAARAMKDDPIGFSTRALLGVTIPSLMVWAAAHDDPRYADQPDYIRDLYWVIPTGTITTAQWKKMTPEEKDEYNREHPIWLWPKPHEIGVLFGSSVERMLDYLKGRDPEAMTRWAKSLISVMLPNFLPSFVGPSLENALNYSTWRGSNIVPRDLEEVEAGLQATSNTSATARQLAAFTNKVTMPQWAGKGWGLQSPIKIENLIRGQLGGMSRLGLDVTDALINKATGAPPEPSEPLIYSMWMMRRFFRRYPTTQVKPVERFYDQAQASSEAQKSFDELKSKGDRQGLIDLQARRGFDLKMAPFTEAFGSALSKIRQKINTIHDDATIDPDSKRAMMDQLTFKMIDIAQRGYDGILEKRAEDANMEKGKIKFPNALGIDAMGGIPSPDTKGTLELGPTPKPEPTKKATPYDVSQAMRRGKLSSADIPKIAKERRAGN